MRLTKYRNQIFKFHFLYEGGKYLNYFILSCYAELSWSHKNNKINCYHDNYIMLNDLQLELSGLYYYNYYYYYVLCGFNSSTLHKEQFLNYNLYIYRVQFYS